MRTDRDEKTILIPGKVIDGRLQFLYGGKLPELREGAEFDLRVRPGDLVNRAFLRMLDASEYRELPTAGSDVWMEVSAERIPRHLAKHAFRLEDLLGRELSFAERPEEPVLFVNVKLQEPLRLWFRGTRLGRLGPVKCSIPALRGKRSEARSLNIAYRLISEAFESQRDSHAGNVFKKALVIDRGRAVRLDEMRILAEKEFEESFRKLIALRKKAGDPGYDR